MRASSAVLLLLMLTAACSAPPSSPMPMQGANGGVANSVELLPSHVGRRVRAVFKNGSQIVTGTVLEVDRERDIATVQADYGSAISFRPSQIAILEVFPKGDEHANHRDHEAAPVTPRLSLAPQRQSADSKIIDGDRIQLLVVDWAAKKHDADACLVDLRAPLEKAPSTILWNDGASTATLRVPMPEDPEAKILPFAWHAHVVWGPIDGKKEERRDLFVAANTDGEIIFELKQIKDARQILLMGVPYRVENKMNGINAIAPPRMIAIDLEDAGKSRAMLENNPAFVNRVDTSTGRLYVASQSLNDSEIVLSAYDPEKASSAAMPQVRYSVQDALLHPAWTLDVVDSAGKHWQRLGGYPLPPSLSFEVPDAMRVTLEIGMAKLGDFSAPPIPSVRVPESALVRADLDIRYAGIPEGQTQTMLTGYGLPTDPNKERLFSPSASEVTAEKPYEQKKIDTWKLVSSEDGYPCQAFVWYQLSTPWKKTGGFMAGATPMRAPETKAAPARRVAHYPAISPGVRFITFNGPKGGGAMGAGVPAALGGSGLGGQTIGTGGPYVPFSPMTSSAVVVDRKGSLGLGPCGCATSSSVINFKPSIKASASSSSTAIAICDGGGSGKCQGDGGGGTKKDPDRPDVPTPGQPPKPAGVPSIDSLHPRPADLPYLQGLSSGWKS